MPLDSSNTHRLRELIRDQEFFAGFSSEHVDVLAESAMEVDFESGHTLFDEGSAANRFYLVLEGKGILESEIQDHLFIPIAFLETGDIAGWGWLIPHQFLRFTARALIPMKTICFHGARLQDHCTVDHEFGYQFLNRVIKILALNMKAMQRGLGANAHLIQDGSSSGQLNN